MPAVQEGAICAKLMTTILGGNAVPTLATPGASTAAHSSPLSGVNRTPRVNCGIDAIDPLGQGASTLTHCG
jgi:hypothetical protein